MNSAASFLAVALFSLSIPLVGCSSPAPEASGASEADIKASKVLLPKGDPCREVLGTLALGLADGATGLDRADAIRVSLASETDVRSYVVFVDGRSFGGGGTTFPNDWTFTVTLDNDSASMCLLLDAELDQHAKLTGGATKHASGQELDPTSAPVNAPAGDACASTVRLLGRAVAVSAVGPDNLVKADIALDSETEFRDYSVHVDGKSFVANGKTFENDFDFALELDNDSASMCVPLSLKAK